MTMTEKRKLRHYIARFIGVKHNAVDVISLEAMNYCKDKVLAKINGFTYGFVVQGDVIKESWRVATS